MNIVMTKISADLQAAAEVMTNLAVELKAAREEFEKEIAKEQQVNKCACCPPGGWRKYSNP